MFVKIEFSVSTQPIFSSLLFFFLVVAESTCFFFRIYLCLINYKYHVASASSLNLSNYGMTQVHGGNP